VNKKVYIKKSFQRIFIEKNIEKNYLLILTNLKKTSKKNFSKWNKKIVKC
jgi:hypothetical protein